MCSTQEKPEITNGHGAAPRAATNWAAPMSSWLELKPFRGQFSSLEHLLGFRKIVKPSKNGFVPWGCVTAHPRGERPVLVKTF